MIDPMPMLRAEIAAIPGVAAIVGANPTTTPRVRIDEPAPGDANGPGSYRAFIVLNPPTISRRRRRPVADVTVGARCYGRTAQEAQALYGALSDGVHDAGPRVNAANIGIYNSADDAANPDKDPDTEQPVIECIIGMVISTMAVPA